MGLDALTAQSLPEVTNSLPGCQPFPWYSWPLPPMCIFISPQWIDCTCYRTLNIWSSKMSRALQSPSYSHNYVGEFCVCYPEEVWFVWLWRFMVLFCPSYLVLLTWHKPGLIGEEEISIEEIQPIGKFGGGAGFDWWSMGESPTHCGWCHPWDSGPGWYQKASWVSHGKQAS